MNKKPLDFLLATDASFSSQTPTSWNSLKPTRYVVKEPSLIARVWAWLLA